MLILCGPQGLPAVPPASGSPLCLGWASEARWVRCTCLPRAVCFLAQGQSVSLMASQPAGYRTVAVVMMAGVRRTSTLGGNNVITWSIETSGDNITI